MIASPDALYDIHRKPSPWPGVVREPTGDRPATDAIPAPARASAGVVARDVGSAPSGSGARTASPDAASAPSRPEPVSAPSPSEAGKPDDDLARLGDRIAELAAGINAAEAQMMTLIADFDRRGGWKDDFGSCAEWLAWRIGIKIGPARERVRAARALENLPQTAGALREGSISYAKVRALTRVATPESEAKLLEFARAGSAANLEQMVRMWKKLSRDAELTAEQARHRSRAFSVFVDGDGMYVVKGRLEPEVGAVLMRAVEAASDALFRGEGDARDAAGSGSGVSGEAGDARPGAKARDPRIEKTDPRPEPKQRRADAVGLLAERALAMGFGDGEPRDSRNGSEPDPRPQTRPRVESGTRAERYQVMVHCDAATLAAEGEPGRSDLDGIRVSAETSRRMACDAAVVAMVHAKDGSMLSVGRTDAHDSTAHPAGAGGARPGMPFSRVWLPVHRGASREALGRRGRNQPQEHAAALPAASSRRSRGAGESIGGHRWDRAVLHASREDAGRRAETSLEGFGPGPIGASRRPGERRWPHALERGRALSRFGDPLGDRGRCSGSRGGVIGELIHNDPRPDMPAGAPDKPGALQVSPAPRNSPAPRSRRSPGGLVGLQQS